MREHSPYRLQERLFRIPGLLRTPDHLGMAAACPLRCCYALFSILPFDQPSLAFPLCLLFKDLCGQIDVKSAKKTGTFRSIEVFQNICQVRRVLPRQTSLREPEIVQTNYFLLSSPLGYT